MLSLLTFVLFLGKSISHSSSSISLPNVMSRLNQKLSCGVWIIKCDSYSSALWFDDRATFSPPVAIFCKDFDNLRGIWRVRLPRQKFTFPCSFHFTFTDTRRKHYSASFQTNWNSFYAKLIGLPFSNIMPSNFIRDYPHMITSYATRNDFFMQLIIHKDHTQSSTISKIIGEREKTLLCQSPVPPNFKNSDLTKWRIEYHIEMSTSIILAVSSNNIRSTVGDLIKFNFMQVECNNSMQVSRNISFLSQTTNHLKHSDSLIFIGNESISTEDALSPFTLASWIGIITAYVATAIFFGTIKSFTINTLDNAVYHHCMQRISKCIYDKDRQIKSFHPQAISSSQISSQTVTGSDDNLFIIVARDYSQIDVETGDNLTKEQIDKNESFNKNRDFETSDVNHGRWLSKAMLHATIRVVSFVFIATYEGKLYDAVTSPKLHLVSTVQDLVASEKYSVKITREVETGNHLMLMNKAKIGHFNGDMMGNYLGTKGDHEKAHNNYSKLESDVQNKNGVVEIEDCIDWVESNSNFPDDNSRTKNHACVGYEFELRNLHKSHRLDKLVAKTNRMKQTGIKPIKTRTINKYDRVKFSLGKLRQGGGPFRLSKFPFRLMDSGLGLMRLWNLAETSFIDSMLSEKLSSSKTFTIKDYFGLFMVCLFLLILSCLTFMIEIFSSKIIQIFKNYCTQNKYAQKPLHYK